MINTNDEIIMKVNINRVETNDTNIFLRMEIKNNIVFSSWVNENDLPIDVIAKSIAITLAKDIVDLAKERSRKH